MRDRKPKRRRSPGRRKLQALVLTGGMLVLIVSWLLDEGPEKATRKLEAVTLEAVTQEAVTQEAVTQAPAPPTLPAEFSCELEADKDASTTRFDTLRFVQESDLRYVVALGPYETSVNLAAFVARVPAVTQGLDAWTRYALAQRELNRVETRFPIGQGTLWLANNCLKCGLWEVGLRTDGGEVSGETFHGWFTFPEAVYAAAFERLAGVSFESVRSAVLGYPKLDGMALPLSRLRRVDTEAKAAITRFPSAPPRRFAEQRRKAALRLWPEAATYAELLAPSRQPLAFAAFIEPGRYEATEAVRVDLAWLAQPASGSIRRVTLRGGQTAVEVEIRYQNGSRLVLGSTALGTLEPHAELPSDEGAWLRLSFGVGTPDIYAAAEERKREVLDNRTDYAVLFGAEGHTRDNHEAGLDRVYAVRVGNALRLALVAYERIAIVDELALPWPDTELPALALSARGGAEAAPRSRR